MGVGCSKTRGVKAPFTLLLVEGADEYEGALILLSSEGDNDRGLEMSLVVLEPQVAAMDGEEGGSGERVKYTTFASDPPTLRLFNTESAK